MRFVKFFIICFGVFFLILLGFSWFIPSEVHVSRAINLAAHQSTVLNNINDFAQWKNWYDGFDHVVLTNEKMEKNKLVSCAANGILLNQIVSNDSLVTVTMTKNKRPIENSFKLIRYANVDSITLQNYMVFKFKWYPWEKLSSLFFDKNYGPIMEKNLVKLKEITP